MKSRDIGSRSRSNLLLEQTGGSDRVVIEYASEWGFLLSLRMHVDSPPHSLVTRSEGLTALLPAISRFKRHLVDSLCFDVAIRELSPNTFLWWRGSES